jgi:ribosome-binding factor A
VVSKSRATRIGERIQQELMGIVLQRIQDPRLNGLNVTQVRVDRELAYANVYVCVLEGEQRSKEVLAALEHAQGFLRSELARRVELRAFPRLRFHWDPTLERAEKIEVLLASLRQEPKPADDQVDDEPA